MELSCSLGTIRKETFPECHIIYVLLTSLFGQDSWILASFFFACLWTSTPSRSINTKKVELGQYPAIVTSHQVNNPYISPVRPYISPSLFTVLLIADFLFRSPRFVTTSPTKRFTPKKNCTISRASSNQASLGDILKPTSPFLRAQSPNLSRTLSAAWREEGV